MAIGTDDLILKFGTFDTVSSGTPGAIANNTFVIADQGTSVNWTNSEDAEFAAAVLACAFTTTMPTVGNLGLYARLHDVQSTNDVNTPDSNFPHFYCGTFPIDFGVSAGTTFYTVIPRFAIPVVTTAQRIDWWIYNNGTSQSVTAGWALYIAPRTVGPSA